MTTNTAGDTAGQRRGVFDVDESRAGTRYQGTFHARPDQVSRVRAAVAEHLGGSPVTDDALVVVSELATNALLHSDSRDEFFTVRCEVFSTYVWLEVEDLGGPWLCAQHDDRPHGLYIVDILAGPDSWGIEMTGDGDRIVWVRLDTAGKTGRPARDHDVSELTGAELERARRDLAVSLALAWPASPARGPILAQISAIDTELTARSARVP